MARKSERGGCGKQAAGRDGEGSFAQQSPPQKEKRPLSQTLLFVKVGFYGRRLSPLVAMTSLYQSKLFLRQRARVPLPSLFRST